MGDTLLDWMPGQARHDDGGKYRPPVPGVVPRRLTRGRDVFDCSFPCYAFKLAAKMLLTKVFYNQFLLFPSDMKKVLLLLLCASLWYMVDITK